MTRISNMADCKEREFKSSYSHKYLIVFAQEHVNFRLEELYSVCSLFDISIDEKSLLHKTESPFITIELKDDKEAARIASRSILIKSIFKLYGRGETLEKLTEILKQYNAEEILKPSRKDDSFKINVDSFNKKLSQEMKLRYIVSLSFLPLDGEVDLRNPGTAFSLMVDHSSREQSDVPTGLFFGRLISNGQRHLIKHYSLKTRHFIGNTSMDAQLALVMANMAKCEDGMFVYDPFVGTEKILEKKFSSTALVSTNASLSLLPRDNGYTLGSILVGCSHFGSYSCGSDIDRTLLLGRGHPSRAQAKGKWREKGESVKSNFKMYNLHDRYIDVWIGDQMNTALKRHSMFDAIVTDPPYGIREGSRKLAKALDQNTDVNQDIDAGFKLPSTQSCLLSDAIYNLLEFSVAYLVLHGRLVFWLPTHRSTFGGQNIPNHPCLKLLHVSEQLLSGNVSRHLITMEKIREPQEGETVSADEQAREIYDQFRNQYFKTKDVG